MRFKSNFLARYFFSNRFWIVLPVLLAQVFFLQPVQRVGAAPSSNELAQPGAPNLILTKSIEGGVTTAQVGDIIRYRIRFECSSLTGPCGAMEITDVLDAGLSYLPPPASSVPAGFTITEGPTGTITITKDDNMLLDGSQYDAVIAVVVDYDLRPLPAFIDNQVNGRIDPGTGWINATPADAPQIEIGEANPYWGLTKSLSSPIINPTVNTDVTYRIQLCPTTPPPGEGNVPLRDIVITDTLPALATFVSASNGGTESLGVVTWPNFAGPIYPPNCLTRYVTIRYNSPPFNVGDNVTNTASANGTYTDSDNNPIGPIEIATDPILHPIDPIVEVPTYSKNDSGDPVGITGTARFTLNLNTNATNYPSNELILIDNLPPELQVTTVTSGQWSAAFDFVQAYVEYSTNNGSSYTAFPGQPISYNTNATYTAPLSNITNVRWRFEYDPDGAAPFSFTQSGLPYTWSFTTSPEIRVTPRAVATVADPPSGAAMPAAIAGTTYDNCLQVSRRNSSGTSVLDGCNIEQMTVEGNFVSLRVSKAETPGEGWDDLSDPNINSFVSDSSILPGDTVRYVITVEITERSAAQLINPTIQDTLPAATDFVFVRNGTARLDGVALPDQPYFTQAGQVLTWAWNNPSPALAVNPLTLGSRYLTVEFFGYVPRGQAPGTYTNDLYVVTDSVEAFCENGTQEDDQTNGDVDGDGDATDNACRNPDTYVVERSAALRGEKWIRSTDTFNSTVVLATTFLPDGSCPNGGPVGLPTGGSNPFTRYPCISQAFPEGALPPGQFAPPTLNTTLDDFEYNLRIFNDGNVPMLEYVLYDILPYVGDTGSGGTLSGSPRLSEFRPIMRGPVEFISGPSLSDTDFTIEYNNTTNPCRPEVFNQPMGTPNVPSGCNDTWSTTWTTSALSYRIRLNSGSLILPASTSSEVRFGVPMYIPLDADPTGFDPNDALSHEIAWNSYSHVGSYDKDPGIPVDIQDLLASEPRKVGITIPEVMSVGNRVWRDADNSGMIDAPDDTNPGIAGVTVNLYEDFDNNGLPDGAAVSTTTTDTEGYYLFSNIPYDSAVPSNNRYIIGIPASNFSSGQPLDDLRSSTGTPPTSTYINPPSTNGDRTDNGIDPVTPGQEVFSASFELSPTTEPAVETDLSNNDRDGLAGQRRGVNGERDTNSDLTIDFGFFGGTDIPFSIGNHVWKDDGTGGGTINDGIRQAGEPPVVGAAVQLYRDGNANGIPEAAEMIRTDVTDANGFYLFDNLDPGPYYVEITAANFATGQPLAGWYSSQPTGTETVGVNGNTTTADIDNDDNGINANFPEITGVFSGVVVLTRGTPEPTGETFFSSEADPGSPANQGYNPTGWDGPSSIGRFGESDATSNVTIDFGFIPPMSLGNRVWFDEGAGTTPFRVGYDNGLQDGTEVGVANVRVELWRDTNGTPGLQVSGTPDTFMYFTTTDPSGYYLFERLQPASDYFVQIPASNFAVGQPLRNYVSSTDAYHSTAPVDDFEDMDDDGIDNAAPATNGITSPQITMAFNSEPLTPANETNIPASGFGTGGRGNFGQADENSNLTMDFGFIRPPRSIGNRVWFDTDNSASINAGDDFDAGTIGDQPGIPNVRVSLYLDVNADNQPDDLGTNGDRTDDWVAYDITDSSGYYLFDKLPPGIYIVGVDRLNFVSGGPLEAYNSSRGSVDNASNNANQLDNGVDRLLRADPTASPHGILATRINLTATPVLAPTNDDTAGTISSDTGMVLGFNPTEDDGTNARGRFNEADNNSDLTLDFGFFIPMSLGNRVFLDDGTGGGTTNNGIMDGGELPIANVRVELYRDANTDGVPDAGLVAFDVTDADGYYLFDDLAAGSYVVVIPSGNFSASFDPDGGGPLPTAAGALLGRNTSTPTGTETVGVPGDPYTPNTDRDDNGLNVGTAPTTGGIRSGTITLAYDSEPTGEIELSGQANPGSPANLAFNPTGWDGPTSSGRWEESDDNGNLTVDFGFIPVFSLGNRVWFDTDSSSTINIGTELGVDGVRVQLYSSDGVTEINVGPDGILNTTDDASGGMLTAGGGYYRFNNLPAGDYYVVVSSSNFGAAGVLRGYWSSGTTISGVGVISETAAALANGDLDSDDNGTLSGGAVVSSVITLGPVISSEPLAESDLSSGQGQPDGQANMTVDFGFYRVEVGDLVYLDNNFNGNYDGAPDTVISGATVRLFAANGTTEINVGPDGILGTTDDAAGGMPTNGSGLYLFTGLPQGQYVVKTTAPTGTYSTIDTFNVAGDNANPDINANNNDNGIGVTNGVISSGVVTLTPGSTGALNNNTVTNNAGTTSNPTVDFGFVGMVAIGNRVWLDDGTGGGVSNNGILDGSEIGVANVTLELYTSSGTFVSSTITNATGHYQFDQLYPGTYYVLIPAAEFQAGGNLETYYSSVGNGANETSDENADENGIDDVTPEVNGIRSTDYALLAGSETTTDDETSYTGTLADANVNFTADFGFTQKYALGNRVWFDTDNSSTINGSEVGTDGVIVNLYAASDLNTILASDTTSDGGYYLFDDLYPGDYVVSIASGNFGGVLSGYWSSATSRDSSGAIVETTAALANSNTDSDDNGTLQNSGPLSGAVISSAVTLGPSGDTEPTTETDLQAVVGQGNQANGRANMTVDFGFYKVSVGDLVWADADKDGFYDSGEPLFDGVTVYLYAADSSGNPVSPALATTTTNSSGQYLFDGLPNGDYIVAVDTPAGTFSTIDSYDQDDNDNPDENTNDNDNGVGVTGGTVYSEAVTLAAGNTGTQNNNVVDDGTGPLTIDYGATHNPTLDFGFTPVYSLGNRVWYDTDNDSQIDSGEFGVDDVWVQLFASDGSTEINVGPDGILNTLDDTSGGMQTANGGYYLFNGLEEGNYIVVISASNFASGEVLEGYWSSGTARNASGVITESAAPDADLDSSDTDDNGTLQASGSLSGAVIAQIVTLGPTFNEPQGETDLDATLSGNQQGQPDAQANMTVDFGFYTITLGDLVWNDANNSGTVDGAETGINGVAVELYVADSLGNPVGAAIDTTTTSGSGIYTFPELPEGNYIVVLPEGNFMGTGVLRDYYSSTNGGSEPAPNPDTDIDNSDDNGSEVGTLGFTGGTIESTAFALTPGAEDAATSDATTGTTAEPRVDFGVFNAPQVNLTVTKDDGVSVYTLGGTLTYTVTVTNNGPADVIGMTVTDARPGQISSWDWACDSSSPNASPAAYGCSPDNTNPATFTDTLDLPYGASVTYEVTATIHTSTAGDLTNTVQVAPPTSAVETDNTDNEDDDVDQLAEMNITKDDGVMIVSPGASLTYTIVVENTGDVDLSNITVTDTLPSEVNYQSASIVPTSISGDVLTWTGISLTAGSSQTITVNVQVDNIPVGSTITNTVTAETTTPPITDQDDDTDTISTNSNFRKTFISTDAGHTADDNPATPSIVDPLVTIGEIITYELEMVIPAGSLDNVLVVDTPQAGLAFVDCSLNIPTGVTSTELASGACNDGTNAASSNPLITNSGGLITFDFGTVANTSGTDQTIDITYQLIVLDIAGNQSGTTLSNDALWTWTGGSLTAGGPVVEVVEPEMLIEKDVTPSAAPIGSVVTYTIDISHDMTTSTADAFDVVVTDTIPSGLALNEASIQVTLTGGSFGPPTGQSITTTPTSLTVRWDVFPLEAEATITFEAVFTGPAPVFNTSNVEWSSLEIDPAVDNTPPTPDIPVQLSDYNTSGTERWYDPSAPAGINNYVVSSTVRLSTPARLPRTGFAPGEVTELPQQPSDLEYTALGDMWLEIPRLGVKVDIVGVPLNQADWNLTWLAANAGYLEGTAFPTHAGNTGITAHAYLADGTPGPFVNLEKLQYGDQIIVHLGGQKYIYEVRQESQVRPDAVASVLKHEKYAWLTLITCKSYNEQTGDYTYRSVARAVLVDVIGE